MKNNNRIFVMTIMVSIFLLLGGCNDGGAFISYEDCKLKCDNPTHIINFDEDNNYLAIAGYVTSYENSDGGTGLYARYYGIGYTLVDTDGGEEGIGSEGVRALLTEDDFDIGEDDIDTYEVSFAREDVPRQEASAGYLELESYDDSIVASYYHAVENPCKDYKLEIRFEKSGTDDVWADCRYDDGPGGWTTISDADVNPPQDYCKGSDSLNLNKKCTDLTLADYQENTPEEFQENLNNFAESLD